MRHAAAALASRPLGCCTGGRATRRLLWRRSHSAANAAAQPCGGCCGGDEARMHKLESPSEGVKKKMS
jgi:hypothetical protein